MSKDASANPESPNAREDVESDPSLDDGSAADWSSEGGATEEGAAAPGEDQADGDGNAAPR